MTIPNEERADLHLSKGVKAALVAGARAAGQSLNEYANEVLCRAFGLDLAAHPVVRKSPGRKLGAPEPNGDAPSARPQRKRGEQA